MERRLPAEYEGWQAHEPVFRRLTTPELVQEIQDGSPERRLAALSVIDLADVAQSTVEDWIHTLPDAEANELAGAIPAQRAHASCDEDARWIEVARLGYEWRRLPTFLVMLFSSLESMESKDCERAKGEWARVGAWIDRVYNELADDDDQESIGDISLFVFENYLDRDPIFDAFRDLVENHLPLAEHVSENPSVLLAELPEEKQRRALMAAEEAGGLPFETSWAALHEG